MNVGPVGIGGMISGITFEKFDTFRNFDTQSTNLTFWGEDFNIKAMVDETQRILPLIEEAVKKFR